MPRSTRVNPPKAVSGPSAALCVIAGMIGGLAPARAAEPRISRIFPPCATAGEIISWDVRGRGLESVVAVSVEGSEVTTRILEQSREALRVEAQTEADATPGFRLVRVRTREAFSNPRLIRVDRLKPIAEAEPNDSPARATALERESAGAGVLKARDVDYFRFPARKGERLTIEVEARRLGSAVAPVVSLSNAHGQALAQVRATPGLDGDCRLAFSVPEHGDYVLKLHDNLYQGSEAAVYRLRITEEPFAEGMFPLGGNPGSSAKIAAWGGTLRTPLDQMIVLSNEPGFIVEVPPFAGGVLAPGRLVVGEIGEKERIEPTIDRPHFIDVAHDDVIEGWIGRAMEEDRYRIQARADEPLRVSVGVSRVGSLLDPVVTFRDETGKVVGEGDDSPSPFASRRAGLGLAANDPDAMVTVRPDRDARWMVEVRDRFNEGGPGYGYRLTARPPRPMIQCEVLLWAGTDLTEAGRFGRIGAWALNLTPGSEASIPFAVAADGKTGAVTVRVEGLPEGIRADPVVVRPPSSNRATEGTILLRALGSAPPGIGWARLVASSRPPTGPEIGREADVFLVFEPLPGQPLSRPVVVRGGRIPVMVGEGNRKVGE